MALTKLRDAFADFDNVHRRSTVTPDAGDGHEHQAGDALAHGSDLGRLLLEAAVAKTRRVITDRDVCEATRPCSERHFLDREPPIRPGCVHVEITSYRVHQGGKTSFAGGRELVPVLSELRRDPGVAERGVDLLLALHRQRLTALALDPPLRDRESLLDGRLAQCDVVAGRAGEVLEQIPVTGRRHDAEISRDAVLRDDRRLCLTVCCDLGCVREVDVVLEQRGRVVRRRDQIDILDRLCTPSHAAGRRDPRASRVRLQVSHQLLDQRERATEQDAPLAEVALRACKCLENPLLRPGTEARQCADPTLFRGYTQIIQRLDVELLPEASCRLRPDPRYAHHIGKRHRNPVSQLRQSGDVARVDELDDLGLDRLADSVELRRVAFARQGGDAARRVADALRCIPIGAQPERVGAVDLEQIGQQIERVGEFSVARERGGHDIRDHRPVLVVCLPTYNERENIEPMLVALGRVFENLVGPTRVIVIDDGSPDGTGEIAEQFAAEAPWVEVIHRQGKQGLGPAYLAGFERALADGAELVVEMDCDFSHEPSDVARLVDAATNADLVLGSRYVDGGGTRNWSLLRRIISQSGSVYAQLLLGTRVADLTGGFKCFRRTVLETLPLDRVATRGYAFQIELTYRTLRAGFSVVEIPIVFTERAAGDSKMSKSIVAEAIWAVPAIRIRSALGRL